MSFNIQSWMNSLWGAQQPVIQQPQTGTANNHFTNYLGHYQFGQSQLDGYGQVQKHPCSEGNGGIGKAPYLPEGPGKLVASSENPGGIYPPPPPPPPKYLLNGEGPGKIAIQVEGPGGPPKNPRIEGPGKIAIRPEGPGKLVASTEGPGGPPKNLRTEGPGKIAIRPEGPGKLVAAPEGPGGRIPPLPTPTPTPFPIPAQLMDMLNQMMKLFQQMFGGGGIR